MGVLAIFSTGTNAIIGTTCVESETCKKKYHEKKNWKKGTTSTTKREERTNSMKESEEKEKENERKREREREREREKIMWERKR